MLEEVKAAIERFLRVYEVVLIPTAVCMGTNYIANR